MKVVVNQSKEKKVSPGKPTIRKIFHDQTDDIMSLWGFSERE